MNVGEKLSELRNNILRDSSDLIAGDVDHLWSDDTLLRYIKQGERRFARMTLCLRDGTTAAVTQVKLKAGQKTYPLHNSIVAVLSARYDTDDFDLQRSGHAIIAQGAPLDFLTFDPSATYTVPPGRPTAYYTDETLVYASANTVTATFYAVPGADQEGKIVYLRVCRMPITEYSQDNIDEESEIPEDYELDPLQWAAYLATRNHDGDAGSPTRSDKHETAFSTAVAAALKDMRRRTFAQMNHRFGMGGFTWSR